jgi:hypothetical protein
LNDSRGFHRLLSAGQFRCRAHGGCKIHGHVLVPLTEMRDARRQ